jgi:hypothetical protein
MDRVEIQNRRREELEALQAFYGDQLLPHLPSDTNSSNADVSINGPWFIQLTSLDTNIKSPFVPTLEIRLPPNYPFFSSEEAPVPILHNVDYHLSSSQKGALIAELNNMYEAEMDVGILWAERCREEFLDVSGPSCDAVINDTEELTSNEVNNMTMDTEINISVMFLSYNHLLYGKSHKKEAQLVSTASKMGLVGFVTYGTPGIVGVLVSKNNSAGITSTESDVVDFSKECIQIGKKCTILDVVLELNDGGIDCKQKEQHKALNDQKSRKKGAPQNKSQANGLHSFLAHILGEDKVSMSKNNSGVIPELLILKKGLNALASCADLKKLLVDGHGMELKLFQQIIGVA